MAEKRRPCRKCNRNRAERFFVGPRGSVCATCRKRRTSTASRAVRLMDTYGITEEDYEAILAAQGGVCAICKSVRPYRLDVDHDHALQRSSLPVRECVRGLACKRCNRRLLPAACDSIDVLLAAIEYLRNPPARAVLMGDTVTAACKD